MNGSVNLNQAAIVADEQKSIAVQSPARLPGLLRLLGGAAVLGSAVIFMAQGLSEANISLRNWVYLVMMVALSAGGVFSIKLMRDDKGARLFFGLAAALVAVQASQLGALIMGLTASEPTADMGMFQVPVMSAAQVLGAAAASLLLGVPAAFAGFSVFARPFARPLTGAFVLLNLLLVLPLRQMPMGVAVLALMATIYVLLEMRVFSRNIGFATLEGAAVRAILVVPLTIASIRAGYYVDDLLGFASLLLLAAVMLAALRRSCARIGWANELLTAAAFTCAATGAWALAAWSCDRLHLDGSAVAYFYCLPVAGLATVASAASRRAGGCYRAMTTLATLILIGSIWRHASPLDFLLLCLYGCGLLLWGVVAQRKFTALSGGAMALLCFAALVVTSFGQVAVNSWMVLAVVGIGCVVMSSVLERHGGIWLRRGRDCAHTLSSWRY